MSAAEEFERLIIDGSLAAFVEICRSIGGEVDDLSNLAEKVFHQLQWFIASCAEYKRPNDSMLTELIKPISYAVEHAAGTRNKSGTAYLHQSAFAELIQSALWIVLGDEQAPISFIEDQIARARKYSDRLTSQPNLRDPTPMEKHKEWANLAFELFQDLKHFVEEKFPKGLVWNQDPDAPEIQDVEISPENKKSKKISTNPVEGKISYAKGTWIISKFQEWGDIPIPKERLNMKQGVVITDCFKSTLNVCSKVKAVLLENSKNIEIEVHEIVSGITIVNAKNVKVFVNAWIPSVTVERSSEIEIFIAPEALTGAQDDADSFPEIFTTNSELISLLLPRDPSKGKDYAEYPIPTQLQTKFTGKPGDFKLTTTAVTLF